MKPGEYIGEDGSKYQWSLQGPGYCLTVWDRNDRGRLAASVISPDWPKAKDALDQLIEREEEPWVELTNWLRIGAKGRIQHKDNGIWADGYGFDIMGIGRARVEGFVKGREVGSAEERKRTVP